MEIAGFAGFFLALFGGFQLLDSGIKILSGYHQMNNGVLPVIAFVVIFLVILISVHIAGRLLKAAFHITPFGLIDNIFGSILGLIKWAFGISLIIWLLSMLEVALPEEHFQNSLMMPYIARLAPLFMDFIAYVIPYFQELLSSIEMLFKKSEP